MPEQTDEHDLLTPEGSLTPRLALLKMPPSAKDPEGLIALHEIAHARTLAGSDFYADFATRTLMGEQINIGTYGSFFEAVPSAYAAAEARSTEGTLANEQTVADLARILELYLEFFRPLWDQSFVPPNTAESGVNDPHYSESYRLLERECILIICRTALELALVREENGSPQDHVRALRDRLEERKDLVLPPPHMTPKDHLETLMNRPSRTIVGVFDDQFRLARVLREGSQETLLELRPLLSVIVRLDFFVYWWPPHLTTSLFAKGTQYTHTRMIEYVEQNAPPPLRPALSQAVMKLYSSLSPEHDGRPIAIHPETPDPDLAVCAYHLFALRAYMAALLDFLEQRLEGSPVAETCRPALDDLRETTDSATNAYIAAVAKKTNQPDLIGLRDRVRFQPGVHADGKDVSYLTLD